VSFNQGFVKTAVIGKIVGGIAGLGGKVLKGAGRAIIKSQGGGPMGFVGAGMTALGTLSDYGDINRKMRVAQMR
jgi:hypothetical protein